MVGVTDKPVGPRRRTPRVILTKALAAAAVVSLLAGCGASGDTGSTGAVATSAPSSEVNHVMPDGSVMEGSEDEMESSATPTSQPSTQAPDEGDDYNGMSRDYSEQDKDGDGHIDAEGVDGEASETATMVCADQVRDAVKRTFLVRTDLKGTPSWDGKTYTCTYPIGGAELVASVRDDSTDTATQGKGYFRILKRQLPQAKKMKGIIGLGFPNYQSPAGHVVFLKDHKTLHVDASGLPASALPRGFSRKDVAYAVASTVMVCWTD